MATTAMSMVSWSFQRISRWMRVGPSASSAPAISSGRAALEGVRPPCGARAHAGARGWAPPVGADGDGQRGEVGGSQLDADRRYVPRGLLVADFLIAAV